MSWAGIAALRPMALVVGLAAAAPACAARSGAGVPAAEAWVRQELWLGAEIPAGGQVTDAMWEAFVADEVAPRFPAGFTVLEAAGHWRHADGAAVRERTRVLVVLHAAGDPAAERALEAIAAAYVGRFGQDAALRTTAPVRVRFVEPQTHFPGRER